MRIFTGDAAKDSLVAGVLCEYPSGSFLLCCFASAESNALRAADMSGGPFRSIFWHDGGGLHGEPASHC